MSFDFKAAAEQLTDDEREEALNHYLEINGGSDAESGIVRQLLGEESKPLSEKQKYVYENNVVPCLAEKCGIPSCTAIIPAGREYCPSCEIKFAVPGKY
ncbi:hypothetical protein [Vibrio sp. WZ-1]|uniref:hypothetical protein n=1 Tax=Vibrio sp. WZ-1 TaxID=3454501 RepID=UPI003F86B121